MSGTSNRRHSGLVSRAARVLIQTILLEASPSSVHHPSSLVFPFCFLRWPDHFLERSWFSSCSRRDVIRASSSLLRIMKTYFGFIWLTWTFTGGGAGGRPLTPQGYSYVAWIMCSPLHEGMKVFVSGEQHVTLPNQSRETVVRGNQSHAVDLLTWFLIISF